MDKIKCGTFGNLPIQKEILKKMEADRAEAESKHETKAKNLPIQRVSNNEVAVCTHDIWDYGRCPFLKGGRDCNKCKWQTDC